MTVATKERQGPLTGTIHDAPTEAHAMTRAEPAAQDHQPGTDSPAGAAPQFRMTREQIELLKRTVCKGATDDELELFVHVCERRRLDPFAKQIHAVKRWDSRLRREVMSFQVGIDGFRLIAERTGKYAGQLPIQWARVTFDDRDEPIIRWYDVWPWGDVEPPHSARARVLRTDFREPIESVARFDAYKQLARDGALVTMWAKMGAEQLGKCAEALGLRKAFPEDLGGMYTPDEMGQADNPERTAESGASTEGARPEEEIVGNAPPPIGFPYPGVHRGKPLSTRKEDGTSYLFSADTVEETIAFAEKKLADKDNRPKEPEYLRRYLAEARAELERRADEAADKPVEGEKREDPPQPAASEASASPSSAPAVEEAAVASSGRDVLAVESHKGEAAPTSAHATAKRVRALINDERLAEDQRTYYNQRFIAAGMSAEKMLRLEADLRHRLGFPEEAGG